MDFKILFFDSVASQLGASLDTIEDLIEKTPDPIWTSTIRGHAYWHVVYHALFYVDLYSNDLDPLKDDPAEQYQVPSLFEGHERPSSNIGTPPKVVLSRDVLLHYIEFIRSKLDLLFSDAKEEHLTKESSFEWLGFTKLETILYLGRHLAQHIGQLTAYLRSAKPISVPWVGKSDL